MRQIWICLSALWLMSGCVTIQTVTVDEKTALELQLMGEREVWDETSALEMTKRDVEDTVNPQFSSLLDARQAQRFLRDEWFVWFEKGCAGFTEEDGGLTLLECDEAGDVRTVFEQELRLRGVIFEWLYENRSYFAGLSSQEARQVFDTLMNQQLDNAYQTFRSAGAAQP